MSEISRTGTTTMIFMLLQKVRLESTRRFTFGFQVLLLVDITEIALAPSLEIRDENEQRYHRDCPL